MNQPPTKTIRGIFWFWTLLYYANTTYEIIQLSIKSFGEQMLFIFVSTAFLLIIYIAIYLTIMIHNFTEKYFSKLELIFFIIGILITIAFFFAFRNNTNIVIQY